MAFAEKFKKNRAVIVAFLGDGTLGEGVVYEALNMASLWSLPILYVVENNYIAQTTPIQHALAGRIASRFDAFGIPSRELDTSDVMEILPAATDFIQEVRALVTPRVLILNTHRFGPHSKGDDTRNSDEIARLYRENDPIAIHASRLESSVRSSIESEVNVEISQAFDQAKSDSLSTLIMKPLADLSSTLFHITNS
jgi:TPP-dependent pyruvate/acetoin dehydrogenase alpha subunit